MEVAFSCSGLSKSFMTNDGPFMALQDVTFDVGRREFLSIVGPSGCGKTTLLKILAELIQPTGGTLEFGDNHGNGRIRGALVFQEHGLYPWMTVRDNVAFGLEMQGSSRAESRAAAERLIAKVGLSRFALSHPHELSGGMRQRVNLARALLADPQMLLMDEPFASLDAQTRLVLQEELLRVFAEEEREVVFITHDIEEAILLSDRVLIMSGNPGRILEEVRLPLERPRDLTGRAHPELAEIKWTIWKTISEEVRRSLSLSD